MSENPKKPDDTACGPSSEEKPAITAEVLRALGHKLIEPTPAKFTVESLRAHGFKVPEPSGEGFIIGAGKVHEQDDKP
jgi:hypothetical protein